MGAVDEFVAPGDPDWFSDFVSESWEEGSSRPGWCFVVDDDSGVVGRVGFAVEPATSDPAWLGTLPPLEFRAFGLSLDWDGSFLPAGRALVLDALNRIAADVPDIVEFRVNRRDHPKPTSAVELFDALGMTLFQEKQGFEWTDSGTAVRPPDRLRFVSVRESGEDAYRRVMAACGEGTIDRNDRHYWTHCGPDNWSSQMMEYLVPADAHMWLLGLRDDEPAGYVAVGSDDEWGSTIAHVGVVPAHRGNGYIHDLLLAGTAAARDSGVGSMLSDVDTLNVPMTNAMRRAGHVDSDWHVWDYRTQVSQLLA